MDLKNTLLMFVFAFGCSESKLSDLASIANGNGPVIEVTPTSLEFGEQSSSFEPSVQSFVVRSIGASTLEVSEISLIGEDAASFTILSDTSFELEPQAEAEIEVSFLPVSNSSIFSQAIISSTAVNEPNAVVSLTGAGIVGELQVSPDPLDFGTPYVGCVVENEVTVTNVGVENIEVMNISHSGGDFNLQSDSIPTLPMTLEPAQSFELQLAFQPSQSVAQTGTLTIDSSEPMGTRNALQTGAGVLGNEVEQLWEFEVNPPSDILFAVDASCSMGDNMNQLSSNFSSFISELSTYSTDWQVMVTGGDTGCNVGGVITPATSSYVSLFQNAVMCKEDETFGVFSQNPLVPECDAISDQYQEALLTEARNAIEETDSGECNAGFLRSNAMLHLILVSDEPEQSVDISGETWQQLADQIIAKRGSAGLVRISAIVGDVPNGCQGGGLFGSDATEGTGYVDASNYTNGVFLSICSNWSSPSNLQLLAEASVLLDSYPLDYQAIPETINVFVNGYHVTTNWSYDSSTQAVVFSSSVPQEGDTVRITYVPIGNCE